MSLGNQHNLSTDFNIAISIKDNIYFQTEFLSFDFVTKLNEAPTGELVLIDRNGEGIHGDEAGNYMKIEFNNVSDKKETKSSIITCFIDYVDEIDGDTANTTYKIGFTAGSAKLLNRITKAYTGTSISAMEEAYSAFGVSDVMGLTAFPDSVKLTDTMTWRVVAENLWEQFNSIVSKSYIDNDYVYWVWDEVSNSVKISSLGISSALPDKYVLMQDDNAMRSSKLSKYIHENPDYTVWYFDGIRRSGYIGKNREALKPNTSLGIIDATKQVSGNVRAECFTETMKSMGDKKGDELQSNTTMSNGSVFGNLKVVRHNKNNTHNMYSVAETVRQYVMGTYAKKLAVTIYNTSGPPIGSKVSVLCVPNNYRTGIDTRLDKVYSDNYILVEKHIHYTTVGIDNLGRQRAGTPKMTVDIGLLSNNFTGTGETNIEKLKDEFKWSN